MHSVAVDILNVHAAVSPTSQTNYLYESSDEGS
jgi:hypothetical protein